MENLFLGLLYVDTQTDPPPSPAPLLALVGQVSRSVCTIGSDQTHLSSQTVSYIYLALFERSIIQTIIPQCFVKLQGLFY